MPGEWKFVSNNSTNGAIFYNSKLDQTYEVITPFSLGAIIGVFEATGIDKPFTRVSIKSFRIERIQQVDAVAAINEGFGVYKDELAKLFDDDPSISGELYLFKENWIAIHGHGSIAKNEWIWVFEFELIKSVTAKVSAAGLSEEQIKSLLELSV